MEYTKNWKKIKKRTGLPDISIRKHDIASSVANLVLAGFSILILRLPIWALPIAFIVSDILLMPLDYVITTLIPDYKKKRQNDIGWLKKRNGKLESLIEKYDRRKSQTHSSRWEAYLYDACTTYTKEHQKNETRIKEIEEENKKKQEELLQEQNVYAKINASKMEQISSVIQDLKRITIPGPLEDQGITLENVVEKSKAIKKLLKARPESVERSAGAFLLYGRELVDILKDIKDMDEDTQVSYIPRIKEALDVYEEYLDRTKERIEKGEAVKMTVDLNVFINELKNNN